VTSENVLCAARGFRLTDAESALDLGVLQGPDRNPSNRIAFFAENPAGHDEGEVGLPNPSSA
jgi:hypothetical protein